MSKRFPAKYESSQNPQNLILQQTPSKNLSNRFLVKYESRQKNLSKRFPVKFESRQNLMLQHTNPVKKVRQNFS